MKACFENIFKGDIDALMDSITGSLNRGEKRFIITANPEIYMQAEKSREVERLLCGDNTVVADGIGVLNACRKLGIDGVCKIPGVELAQRLLKAGDGLGCGAVFIGAAREVNERFAKMVKSNYPGLKILGSVDGYVPHIEDEFKKLLSMGPDIILVALGVPKQELLIDKYYGVCDKGVFVGVGGTFDVLSGMKKRAPKIFLKTNTEWLYRIVTEPKRLGRFFRNNVKFVFRVRRWGNEKQ